MRLDHYRKLYESEARTELEKLSTEQLITQLLSLWGIRDWKKYELEQLKREGQSPNH